MKNINFSIDVMTHVFESLRVNALKSSLIIVSVAIGVMALILGLTFSSTLSKSLVWQFENLGSNTLTVSSYLPLTEQLKGKKAHISHSEYEYIKRNVAEKTQNITPIIQVPGARVQYAGRTLQPSALGTTYSYMQMRSRYVAQGRFINDADNTLRRRSVVIGQTVVDDLSLTDPVGEYIKVNDEWFVIVGVMQEKGSLFGMDLDEIIIMPYQTSQAFLPADDHQDVLIQMNAKDVSQINNLKRQISGMLRELHHIEAAKRDDFKVETTDELLSTFNSVIKIVSVTLIAVVALSLVVASVGMTNIFLLSITERTNEIGLLMALGAGRKFISSLFILESSVLTTAGGIIGMFCGYVLALLMSMFLPDKYTVEFPITTGCFVVLFCFLLGVLVSLIPASKACTLSPSRALTQ